MIGLGILGIAAVVLGLWSFFAKRIHTDSAEAQLHRQISMHFVRREQNLQRTTSNDAAL